MTDRIRAPDDRVLRLCKQEWSAATHRIRAPDDRVWRLCKEQIFFGDPTGVFRGPGRRQVFFGDPTGIFRGPGREGMITESVWRERTWCAVLQTKTQNHQNTIPARAPSKTKRPRVVRRSSAWVSACPDMSALTKIKTQHHPDPMPNPIQKKSNCSSVGECGTFLVALAQGMHVRCVFQEPPGCASHGRNACLYRPHASTHLASPCALLTTLLISNTRIKNYQ